jgi:hypothetical protein
MVSVSYITRLDVPIGYVIIMGLVIGDTGIVRLPQYGAGNEQRRNEKKSEKFSNYHCRAPHAGFLLKLKTSSHYTIVAV